MGAFCTLATYVIMIFNSVSLSIAFVDHSKQDENLQEVKFDRFIDDAYNLKENNIDFTLVPRPPINPKLGRFKISQTIPCEAPCEHLDIPATECSE